MRWCSVSIVIFFWVVLKKIPQKTQLKARVHYYSFICKNDCFIATDQPEITAHPGSVAEKEGNNVTLYCNATGNPVPTISWNRYGSPINTTTNSRISFSQENKQLTITDVNRTDRGEYQCVANNIVGSATSNAATLDIQCNVSCMLKFISI